MSTQQISQEEREQLEQQALRDADELSRFANSDIVARMLGRLERAYYEEFIAAESSEQRIRAQAKAVVLRNFIAVMQDVKETGKAAEQAIETRERRNRPRPSSKF